MPLFSGFFTREARCCWSSLFIPLCSSFHAGGSFVCDNCPRPAAAACTSVSMRPLLSRRPGNAHNHRFVVGAHSASKYAPKWPSDFEIRVFNNACPGRAPVSGRCCRLRQSLSSCFFVVHPGTQEMVAEEVTPPLLGRPRLPLRLLVFRWGGRSSQRACRGGAQQASRHRGRLRGR